MDKQDTPVNPASVSALLARLQGILEEENGLLEGARQHDHQRFANEKNQILRDLMVLQRGLSKHIENPDMLERLRTVRRLIDRNYGLLRSHVDAMGELTNLLTEVEIAEDTDGTYSKFDV